MLVPARGSVQTNRASRLGPTGSLVPIGAARAAPVDVCAQVGLPGRSVHDEAMGQDHFVPHVQQSQAMSCWAASTAMMLGYHRNQSYPEAEVLREFADFGIDGADNEECKQLASRLGIHVLPDQCNSPMAWDQMLARGPIMVGSPTHVIVIAGIRDEESEHAHLKVHDPAQSAEYWGAYQDTERGYEMNPDAGYTVNLFQW